MSLTYEPLVQLKPISASILAKQARSFSIPAWGIRAFQEIRALLKPRDVRDCHAEPRELELFGAAMLLGAPHPINQDFAAHLARRADDLLAEQLQRCRADFPTDSFDPIDPRIVALRNALAGYLHACGSMRAKQDADAAKREETRRRQTAAA